MTKDQINPDFGFGGLKERAIWFWWAEGDSNLFWWAEGDNNLVLVG
jgi:hypothetical protein